MGTQLWRGCVQLPLHTRNNCCRSHRCSYSPAQRRVPVFVRKLSTACSLQDSRIDENTNIGENNAIDEFDEEFMYAYPVDIPQETQPLVRTVLEEAELHSQFHFRGAPKKLSDAQWKKLMQLDFRKRRNSYSFFYWMEKLKETRRKHSRQQDLEHPPKVDTSILYSTDEVVPYSPSRNALFGFIFLKSFEKRTANLRVMKSAIFGPHIIIDCSYESYMMESELTSCVRQLAMLRKDNYQSDYPFNIIHCNVNLNGKLIEKLKTEFVPNCLDPASTFHFTEKNFLDLFPAEKLVYLSPHSETELETYDEDSVYVVGAMVDHLPQAGLSTEKASLSGIRSAKFPLDKHLNWCNGTQCLMLVQSVNIMHDLRKGDAWDKILRRHIREDRTTHASPYWNKPSGNPPSRAGHLHHLAFRDHYIPRNKEVES